MERFGRALADAHNDPVLVVANDGTSLHANAAWLHLFGTAAQFRSHIDPADVDRVDRVLGSRESDSVATMARLTGDDDRAGWWEVTRTPIADAGAPIGAMVRVRPALPTLGSPSAGSPAPADRRAGAWFWTLDSQEVWWTPEVYDILGYGPEVAPAYGAFLERVHPDDLPAVRDLVDEAVATGRPFSTTHRVVVDTQIRYVRSSGTTTMSLEGRPLHVWGQLVDVHEELLAEQDARAQQSRDRMLVMATSDVVSLEDMTGTTTWVQESLTTLFGWSVEEFVGRNWRDWVHPDDLNRLESESATADASVHGGLHEGRFQCKDGSYRWASVRYRPWFEAPGGPQTGWVCAWWDADERRAAEFALAQSEARYRVLAEHATDVVVQLDSGGDVAWVSESVRKLIGVPSSALVGADPADLVHPDDAELCRGALAMMRESGSFDARLRVNLPGDATMWVAARGRATHGADGSVTGYVVGVRDVDAETRSALALADSERRYRMLAENSTDVVSSSDLDDRITWVSDSVTSLLGFSPSDLVGVSWNELVHPDDVHVLDSPAPTPHGDGSQFGATVRMRTDAGTYRWVDVRWRPFEDEQGAQRGWVAAWWDAQARRDAEDALQASEERYRLMAENASDIVLQHELDGTVLWVSESAARLTGIAVEDIVGSVTDDFTHPDDVKLAHATRRMLLTEDTASMRVRVLVAGGQWRWVHVRAHAVRNPDGTLASIVSSVSDVHAETLAAQALEESEARYRLLAEAQSDVVLQRALDGTVVWVSESVHRLIGLEPADIVGRHTDDFTHPDDIALAAGAREQLMIHGTASMRVRVGAADGEWRWVQIRSQLVRDADGAPLSAITSLTDVHAEQLAAQALEESETRYRLLAENASDIVMHRGADGRVTWISDSVEALTGVPAELVIGREAHDLVHPDDVPATLESRERLLAGEESTVLRVRVPDANGEWRWLLLHTRAIRDAAGQFLGAVVGARDVHAETLAAQALEESEARYRLLAENASDIVLTGDMDTNVTWISDSVTATLGWRPEDIVGRDPGQLVHPDDLERIAEVYRRHAADGTPGKFISRVRDVSGAYHRIESRFQFFIDNEGAPVGWVSSWLDRTAEVEAREALEASERRYRMLADTTSDVVFSVDEASRFTWVSPSVEPVLGWTPGDMLGRPVRSMLHIEDVHLIDRAAEQVRSGHDVISEILRFRTASGEHRWMSARVTMKLAPDGTIDDLVGSLRDVDELIRAREKAEEQEARERNLLDSLLDPHIVLEPVFAADGVTIADWILQRANHAAQAYFMHEDGAIGQSLSKVFPNVYEQGIYELYERAWRTGKPVRVEALRYESRRHGEVFIDLAMTRLGGVLSNVWRDATARHAEQAEVLASEERYRLLAENASDIVWQVATDDRLAWVSESVASVLGWAPSDVIGRQVSELVQPDSRVEYAASRAQALAGATGVATVPILSADGTYRWMAVTIRPLDDTTRGATVIALRDVQEEVNVREELEHLSGRDGLTGLVLRDTLMGRMRAAFDSGEVDRHRSAVLVGGLDYLGEVNAAHGHAAGDRVLATTGARLVAAVRNIDHVARAAGDEFVVWLPEISSEQEAVSVAEQIRAALDTEVVYSGHRVPVSASIGVALGASSVSADDMLRQASVAMKQAKSAGRNRVAVVDPVHVRELREHLGLVEELRHALASGQVSAWFTPMVDLRTEATRALHSTPTWVRPDGSSVPTRVFVAAAERAGLAPRLDAMVMRDALRHVEGMPETMTLGIPVSPMTLRTPGFAEQVSRELAFHRMRPERVVLEVTEASLLDLTAASRHEVDALARAGVRFGIRGFGLGFSSLAHLREMPIYGLVLDPSFIAEVDQGDAATARLVAGVAAMSRELGLRTVADGVGSNSQAELLSRHGWDVAIGPWAGPPAPTPQAAIAGARAAHRTV